MKKIIFLLCIILFAHASFAETKMDLGLEVYKNKAQCGVCHTLKAAGSDGQIGPNFDLIKLQISQIIFAVSNGIGVMPPWEGILTYEEIEAVAYYVFHSTNK